MNLAEALVLAKIKATQLGKAAFLAGKCSTPILDNDLTELWKPYAGDAKSIIKIMDAWQRAWHAENLKN
jgi:hypothetical protein